MRPPLTDALKPVSASGTPKTRIRAFDVLRGITIVSMVLFHALYDLAYIYGIPVAWFTSGPVQGIWRISISWVFLALAGWMTSLSRNNLKRGMMYAATALAVWLGTSIARVDTPITFGIMFCMAASTLVWCAVSSGVHRLSPKLLLTLGCLCLACFLATYQLPRQLYQIPGLAWLGFPSAGFSSGDYYPLLPFGLLYSAFACFGCAWQRGGASYPSWMLAIRCAPLEAIGKHSLVIYLAHQVVLTAVLSVIFDA